MELYQLHSFVTVAHEKHLTRAAEKLHTSQPSVSAHIKALEEEFGQALFLRTPRGMSLTAAGTLLYKKARAILTEVQSLAALAENLRQQPTGSITIGLNRNSEFLRIPTLYQKLHHTYPHIEITLHQAISGSILKMIRGNELDCGFILGDCNDTGLISLPLARLKLRVVGPANLEKQLSTAKQSELADFPWIGTPKDCPYTQIMEKFFHTHGITPHTEMLADQQSAIISMIEAGVGLSFMLEEEAIVAEKQGRISIWQQGDFPIDLSFVFREKNQHSPVIHAVTSEIITLWNHPHKRSASFQKPHPPAQY